MVVELVFNGLFVALRGAGLREEQDTNREGVASGSATYFLDC